MNGEPISRSTLEQMATDALGQILGRKISPSELDQYRNANGDIELDWDGIKIRAGTIYSDISSRVSQVSSRVRSSRGSTVDQEHKAQAKAEKQARENAEREQNRRARAKAGEISRARRILGYTAKEPVTKDMVKHRQRELARKHHPDRGGSLTRMQDINWAVDILLGPG